MSIYWSRLFPRSNSSFFLSSGYALKSSVIRLREDKFLVDTGLGTPKIRMKDELTNVPQYRRTARFENKVGYSFNVVAGESTLKKRRDYERFFKDLVAGESRIKERAADNLNSFLGSLDVAAGEPLVLPLRFRQNLAREELNQINRMIQRDALLNKKKSLILRTLKQIEALSRKKQSKNYKVRNQWLIKKLDKAQLDLKEFRCRREPGASRRRTKKNNYKLDLRSLTPKEATRYQLKSFIMNKAQRKKRKGNLVAIAGFIIFMPIFKEKKRKGKKGVKQKKNSEECLA